MSRFDANDCDVFFEALPTIDIKTLPPGCLFTLFGVSGSFITIEGKNRCINLEDGRIISTTGLTGWKLSPGQSFTIIQKT